MKKLIIAATGWLLLAAALAFYAYGIQQAISLSWGSQEVTDTSYPKVLATMIGAIQALLLTNLGAILGISVAKPNSALSRFVMLGKPTAALEIPAPLDIKEQIQLFALICYFLSLITCMVAWIHEGFSTNPKEVVTTVTESGNMFVGVILAYVTGILSK